MKKRASCNQFLMIPLNQETTLLITTTYSENEQFNIGRRCLNDKKNSKIPKLIENNKKCKNNYLMIMKLTLECIFLNQR